MIKKIKNILLTFSAFFVLAVPLAAPVSVLAGETTTTATPQESLCAGANDLTITSDPASNQCEKTAGVNGENKVNNLLSRIINIFSVVVGVIAVIMIIVGGFKYITSGGKEEGIKGAKNTIMYALIGLVVVALAQIIVKFVLNKATA